MDKITFYQQLDEQIAAIISGESDTIANMANISALLFEQLADINWVGFYRKIDNELVLGPFQGKVACIRIAMEKGVCGAAATTKVTQRIADVHQFDGHIACDARTNSELVIPICVDNEVIAVLDIDSMSYNRFDEDDQKGLEQVAITLEKSLAKP
ncbi:GAF domain-containing protein [Thalassotalea sp. PLHSN55]|uniref:GAF domain-containing protein n=1 Tax=Thalassotalea sp. PLHSN55 TaxID=3435888 RepID=UPI003F848D32